MNRKFLTVIGCALTHFVRFTKTISTVYCGGNIMSYVASCINLYCYFITHFSEFFFNR